MNGRMYDPVIGRVLSPDNFVQDPTNTQSYNRYSYCLNNPLRYTDPSGWLTEAAWADISRTWNNMVSDPENLFNGTYSWSSGSRNDIGGIGDICTYSSSEDLMLSTLIDYNNQYSSWSNTTLSSAFGKSSAVDGLKIRWVTWAGTPSNPYQWLTGVRLQNGTFISKFSEGEGKANITNNSKSVNSGEANVEWISQYDTRVPAHGRKACKRACYIMNPDALRGMNNGYFVGKEKAKSFITTNETLQGYQYLNQQLSLNRSVIVGVGRDLAGYWGNNANNDYTTDHFVVIDYAVGGEYHFLDPGTRNPAIGTSVNNVFRLGVNGLYSGSSYGAPMTITWIGLNR